MLLILFRVVGDGGVVALNGEFIVVVVAVVVVVVVVGMKGLVFFMLFAKVTVLWRILSASPLPHANVSCWHVGQIL